MEPATNFYCPDHLVSILIKTEKFSFTEMKIPPPQIEKLVMPLLWSNQHEFSFS